MLHPLLRLVEDPARGWRLRATGRRSLRAMVLVPRSLCVFESLPCKGVRWYELDGFARMQARRLAPFARSGVSAAVRQHTLMLWFWDDTEIDDLMLRAGAAKPSMQRVAESLWLDVPASSGFIEVAGSQGIDQMDLLDGAIRASRWRASEDGRERREARLLKRPWARNRLAGGLDAAAQRGASRWTAPRVVTAVCMFAATGLAAHGAYWGGSLLGAEQRLAELRAASTDVGSEASKINALRQDADADRRWVLDYRELGRSFDLSAFIAALEPPLREHGAVVKELEVRDEDAKLSIVAAAQEIDLPRLLQSLEALPGISQVQVRQNTDPTQAVFGMTLQGFRPLVPAARTGSTAKSLAGPGS